ncbi:hypothetical protein LH51_04300 [Nitrincola sp. A-D6]|uniref:hypothetical protein n=1 Tax=Nitrincola sp. A-D6 TaxID=1545442 RepID=UPI00051F9B5B|nr:hypothetical protein [Nitrincola sp. A-D6]KGK42813.1 hypothetical protein LH51_04300 [Nitrincola sp. A-D6]
MNNFRERLLAEWLEPFCERHGYATTGFIWESVDKLDPADAKDFLAAVDEGLVVHDSGVFRAPCSKATEQIFWQGLKTTSPRKITLWIEPVITMAGLFRLHSKYGWPRSQLGMQSKTWAFDVVAYAQDQDQELLACEVKKSWREIEKLISLMSIHKASPPERIAGVSGAERNALKKVIGCARQSRPCFGRSVRVIEAQYLQHSMEPARR